MEKKIYNLGNCCSRLSITSSSSSVHRDLLSACSGFKVDPLSVFFAFLELFDLYDSRRKIFSSVAVLSIHMLKSLNLIVAESFFQQLHFQFVPYIISQLCRVVCNLFIDLRNFTSIACSFLVSLHVTVQEQTQLSLYRALFVYLSFSLVTLLPGHLKFVIHSIGVWCRSNCDQKLY